MQGCGGVVCVMHWWGGSCRGGVGHGGWDGVGHGWVGWGVSCRGWVGWGGS